MTTEIYRIDDAATGDGLTIERDGSRLFVRLRVEQQTTTLILANLDDARRLADALQSSLGEPLSVPRRVSL